MFCNAITTHAWRVEHASSLVLLALPAAGPDPPALCSAEDRVLWYSAQYRDWDVTNGSVAQEVSPQQLSLLIFMPSIYASVVIGS